jgi:hypothetical protein
MQQAAHRVAPITFYVTPAMYATLAARAVEEERSLSTTIARLVRDALKNSEAAPVKSGFAKSVTALHASD